VTAEGKEKEEKCSFHFLVGGGGRRGEGGSPPITPWKINGKGKKEKEERGAFPSPLEGGKSDNSAIP